MIEELLFSTQISSTGLKSSELPSDHAQPTHHGQTARWKLRTSILPVTGDISWTMLALIGLHWHQKLPSLTILVLIILLVKCLTKSFMAPNHRFLCLSNWDIILTSIGCVVLISARTCFLILTTRTLRRMVFFVNYFVHNFLRLC